MIVKVRYYKEELNAYGGRDYIYKTDLDLKPYEKVFAPVGNPPEDKKALVTEVDLPEDTILKEWAYKVKSITKYDEGEETA